MLHNFIALKLELSSAPIEKYITCDNSLRFSKYGLTNLHKINGAVITFNLTYICYDVINIPKPTMILV